MKISTTNRRGAAKDASGFIAQEFSIIEDFLESDIFERDWSPAIFRDGYRSTANFISSDFLAFDVDNVDGEHCSINRFGAIFENTSYIICTSKSHGKEKTHKGKVYKSADRYHVLFPLGQTITDPGAIAFYASHYIARYPFFDKAVADAARFYFGAENCEVYIHSGENITLPEYESVNVTDSPFRGEVAMDGEWADMMEDDATPASDKQGYAIMETARGLQGRADTFARIVQYHFPDAVKAGNQFSVGSLRGEPGQSLKLSHDKGCRDFESGDKGDLINVLAQKYAVSRLKAAELMLTACGIPFPSASQTAQIAQSKTASDRKDSGYLIDDLPEGPPATESIPAFNPTIKLYPLTDKGNSERFTAAARGSLLYINEEKTWAAWSGNRWQVDESGDGVAYRLAATVARNVRNEAQFFTDEEEIEAVHKWGKASEGAKRMADMVKLATKEIGMTVSASDLDTHRDIINTPLGPFDLTTGKEYGRPESWRDLYLTKSTGAVPAKKAPERFLKFLDEICCGDLEMMRWLQVYFGYSLSGRTTMPAFAVFFGSGANGKTVLCNIIASVMGDYYKATRPDTYLKKDNADGARYDLAALAGARLVVASESDSGNGFSLSTIKELTGDDMITCRHLYGKFFTYRNQAKFILLTNHKPNIGSADKAIRRRIFCVPFDYICPPELRKDNLAESILADERESILGWMLEGARVWYDCKALPPCKRIASASLQYFDDEDLTGQFMCDVTDQTGRDSDRITLKALFDLYKEWAEKSGYEYPKGKKGFGKELDARGVKRRIVNGTAIVFGVKPRYGWQAKIGQMPSSESIEKALREMEVERRIDIDEVSLDKLAEEAREEMHTLIKDTKADDEFIDHPSIGEKAVISLFTDPPRKEEKKTLPDSVANAPEDIF